MIVIKLLECNIEYLDILIRLVSLGMNFDLTDQLCNVHALGHATKHRMLVVQPRLRGGGTRRRYVYTLP